MSTQDATVQAMQPAAQKCPYCYKPIETPVKATINRIGYHPVRRKREPISESMEFCSSKCASNYQMGCEG